MTAQLNESKQTEDKEHETLSNNPSHLDPDQMLIAGIRAGDLNEVKQAWEDGANINCDIPPAMMEDIERDVDSENVERQEARYHRYYRKVNWHESGYSPLILATMYNHTASLNILIFLVEKGAPLHGSIIGGKGLLDFAVLRKRWDIIEYLLSDKCLEILNKHYRDKNDPAAINGKEIIYADIYRALLKTVSDGSEEAVTITFLLLNTYIKIFKFSKKMAIDLLTLAIEANNLSVVEFINDKYSNFITEDLVLIAVSTGNLNIVKNLLKNPAVITPRVILALLKCKHLALVKTLLKDSIDNNYSFDNVAGNNMLIEAIKIGDLEIINVLLAIYSHQQQASYFSLTNLLDFLSPYLNRNGPWIAKNNFHKLQLNKAIAIAKSHGNSQIVQLLEDFKLFQQIFASLLIEIKTLKHGIEDENGHTAEEFQVATTLISELTKVLKKFHDSPKSPDDKKQFIESIVSIRNKAKSTLNKSNWKTAFANFLLLISGVGTLFAIGSALYFLFTGKNFYFFQSIPYKSFQNLTVTVNKLIPKENKSIKEVITAWFLAMIDLVKTNTASPTKTLEKTQTNLLASAHYDNKNDMSISSVEAANQQSLENAEDQSIGHENNNNNGKTSLSFKETELVDTNNSLSVFTIQEQNNNDNDSDNNNLDTLVRPTNLIKV